MMSKNKNHYCVIMAGGIGSRFWPLSRYAKPKQFIDIMGIGKTFLQMTYERFLPFIPQENFLVVTGIEYKELVLEQLPDLKPEQVLLEVARRNTAPCIAYANYKLKKQNKEATVIYAPADHLILHERKFEEVMKMNLKYASENEVLVTTGITPTFPAVGYGYIEVTDKNASLSKVAAFKEKPDLETAQNFLASGKYVWNSGMFVSSVQTMAKALEAELPEIAKAFSELDTVYDTAQEQAEVDKTFQDVQSISIDFGLMEKVRNVYVAEGDFGWSDVGSWGSLYQLSEKDKMENSFHSADTLSFNSERCFIKEMHPHKLVVVDGLKDYLIIDDQDVLMICPRENESRIKELIEKVVEKRQHLK